MSLFIGSLQQANPHAAPRLLQAARASEAEALRRAATLEQELRQAREEAHQLEIQQQDGRAR
jgi:hypothetical protein